MGGHGPAQHLYDELMSIKNVRVLRLLFYAPFICLLSLLVLLIDFLSKIVEYRSNPYWLEAWKATHYLVRLVVWLIGEEELEKLVTEQRRMEMAKIYGVKADEVIRYVPKSCRNEKPEDQPVFKLKFLEVAEFARIQDELFKSSGFGKKRTEKFMLGQQTMLALRQGLIGWENFKYEDGTPVEWEDPNQGRDPEDRARIMDTNLNKIPPAERAEMADYVRGESTLGEDE